MMWFSSYSSLSALLRLQHMVRSYTPFPHCAYQINPPAVPHFVPEYSALGRRAKAQTAGYSCNAVVLRGGNRDYSMLLMHNNKEPHREIQWVFL